MVLGADCAPINRTIECTAAYKAAAGHLARRDSDHQVVRSRSALQAEPDGSNVRRWAGTEGQDFLTNNRDPNIDFAVMHLWVDNWLVRLCMQPQT
jgi:hypothetical protein